MPHVSADADTLMRQAPMTANLYLNAAIKELDELFGKGYAKKNPELVGVFMQTCARDFHTAILKSGMQEIADAIQAHAQGGE